MMQQLAKHIGPAWFQELSETQINAADSIFDAISYDSEDSKYFRTREALLEIGLSPMPKKQDTLAAIQFSRGNDLAFLWHLCEKVYNNCDDITKKKSFSMNERLLMSCICHLDMMTTLRELDKILPKPEKKKKKLKKALLTLRPIKFAPFNLPYDKPVPKPKLQPKRFFVRPQSLHPKFELYKKYKDSSHVIKNESNRWFAVNSFLSSEARIICKAIVCDQIKKVFDADLDSSKVFGAFCQKHRSESMKFNQLMKKVLEGQMVDGVDEDLQDYDEFERGIIYGVQLELAKADKEAMALEEKLEKENVVKSQLKEVIANAVKLRYTHLCKKCEDCINVRKNHIQEEPRTMNSEQFQASDVQPKFFHRPTTTSPVKFDYEKIFAVSSLNDCGVIKNSINKALEVDKHLTEDNAITVCLKDMWQKKMNKWNDKRQNEMEENSDRIVVDCKKIGSNKRKVFNLLCQGIQLMKKNPKFTLASMPGVERLPLLREWVLHRFGIRYNMNENEARWKKNEMHRKHLDKAGILPKVVVPGFKIFGVNETLMSYDEALKKAPKVKFDNQYSLPRNF